MPKWSFEEWGENGLTGLEMVGWMWYNYWNDLTKIKMKKDMFSFFEKKLIFVENGEYDGSRLDSLLSDEEDLEMSKKIDHLTGQVKAFIKDNSLKSEDTIKSLLSTIFVKLGGRGDSNNFFQSFIDNEFDYCIGSLHVEDNSLKIKLKHDLFQPLFALYKKILETKVADDLVLESTSEDAFDDVQDAQIKESKKFETDLKNQNFDEILKTFDINLVQGMKDTYKKGGHGDIKKVLLGENADSFDVMALQTYLGFSSDTDVDGLIGPKTLGKIIERIKELNSNTPVERKNTPSSNPTTYV